MRVVSKLLKTACPFYFFCLSFFLSLVVTAPLGATSLPEEKIKKESSPTILGIEIQGLRKIEKDAVIDRLKSKIGGVYSASSVREDVANLFKMGFFYDIKVDRKVEGGHCRLTYILLEKPSISEITFDGQREIKSEELLQASGLEAYGVLNMNKVRAAVEKIQKLYEEKGYFLAKVTPKVEDVKEGETVKVIFNIKENDKVKVKKITFLGNQKLSDGFLKARLVTAEEGLFTSGAYKQDVFDRDIALIRYIYFDEGYVQVKVDHPQVYVTPDKKGIYITIRIDEGEQFDVGEIDFSGDLLFSREELSSSIEINKRKVFSSEALRKDLGELQAKYGDLGYAFTNVIPRTRINEKDRKVDINFEFDKGSKVYFGQINIVGNASTRDKVIRRELKILEGELYNETRKRQSQEAVRRLGFFEDVSFKTSISPDKPDVLNIEIVVKERVAGSIQFGLGYGSGKFSANGQYQEANFLGYGQKLGAGLNVSDLYSTYFINFTEPYLNDSLWSGGADIYRSQSFRNDYNEIVSGGALRVGHHLTDFLSTTFRYRYDSASLNDIEASDENRKGYSLTDPSIFPLEKANGDTGSLTVQLEYDQRDDRMSPSSGVYASTSLEYAGVGGAFNYIRGNGNYRFFKKTFWNVVWRNNFSYSGISGHSGQDVPFTQKFILGGATSLRGYRYGSIGRTVYSNFVYNQLLLINPKINPVDASFRSNRVVGGTTQALVQSEFEYPLIAEAGIKGVFFYDIGSAEDNIDVNKTYSDVGLGFRWLTVLGLLRFEWGFPLVKAPLSPESVQFQFIMGAPF